MHLRSHHVQSLDIYKSSEPSGHCRSFLSVRFRVNRLRLESRSSACGASSSQEMPRFRKLTTKQSSSMIAFCVVTKGKLGLQDYLIAEGSSDQFVAAAGLFPPSRYYFSQDGMQWSDLDPVNADITARASLLTLQLTGDPSNLYLLPEKLQEASTQTKLQSGMSMQCKGSCHHSFQKCLGYINH